jgi:DivIVA domain-containing protein
MAEQTVVTGTDETTHAQGFSMVRRGYDPTEVDAHLTWLEERLRESEEHREVAETAAADAAEVATRATEESALARSDAETSRPSWNELGGRIAQIFQLAEEEAAVVSAERTRDADEQLAESRRLRDEAEHLHREKIRAAEQQAGDIVQTALTEAERIVRDARSTITQEEKASQQRLGDLARQRSRVHGQLLRLRDEIKAAIAPFDDELNPSDETTIVKVDRTPPASVPRRRESTASSSSRQAGSAPSGSTSSTSSTSSAASPSAGSTGTSNSSSSRSSSPTPSS